MAAEDCSDLLGEVGKLSRGVCSDGALVEDLHGTRFGARLPPCIKGKVYEPVTQPTKGLKMVCWADEVGEKLWAVRNCPGAPVAFCSKGVNSPNVGTGSSKHRKGKSERLSLKNGSAPQLPGKEVFERSLWSKGAAPIKRPSWCINRRYLWIFQPLLTAGGPLC